VQIRNDSPGGPPVRFTPPFYSSLPGGSTYSIVLTNRGTTNCDAIVYMEGSDVAIVSQRLSPGRTPAVISTPQYLDRRFTIAKATRKDASEEPASSSAALGNSKSNGEIKVVFRPQRADVMKADVPVPFEQRAVSEKTFVGIGSYVPDASPEHFSAATVLGGATGFLNQYTVQPIDDADVDLARAKTIVIRLLAL
jgi:hypothetical protein